MVDEVKPSADVDVDVVNMVVVFDGDGSVDREATEFVLVVENAVVLDAPVEVVLISTVSEVESVPVDSVDKDAFDGIVVEEKEELADVFPTSVVSPDTSDVLGREVEAVTMVDDDNGKGKNVEFSGFVVVVTDSTAVDERDLT